MGDRWQPETGQQWFGDTNKRLDIIERRGSRGASPAVAYDASTTGITIGNGSFAGTWTRTGAIVYAEVVVNIGSTTVISDLYITLPVPPVLSTSWTPLGEVVIRDVSGAVAYTGALVVASTTRARVMAHKVVGTNIQLAAITATNPFTFAANDFVAMRFTYAAA